MSKIKDILNDKNTILVFDIDGVLALMEWGEYNHFGQTDEEWTKMYQDNNLNYYTEECVSKRMQDFLKDKDKSKLYVITKAYSENEWKDKINFANKFYNIPKEHVFYVDSNNKKADVLIDIAKKYKEIDEHHIAIIDDTVEVLNDVKAKTHYTTIHISSFLDL